MGKYDDEMAMALELLDDFGSTVTITRTKPGTPAAGDRPSTPPLKIVATAKGVVLPLSRRAVSADEKVGGLIDSNRIAYIAGSGMTLQVTGGTFTGAFEPTADDKLLLEGRLFTVKGNDALNPDGSGAILHRAIVTT